MQVEFMRKLQAKGWMVVEIRDLNSGISTINYYFKKIGNVKKPPEQTALFPL